MNSAFASSYTQNINYYIKAYVHMTYAISAAELDRIGAEVGEVEGLRLSGIPHGAPRRESGSF